MDVGQLHTILMSLSFTFLITACSFFYGICVFVMYKISEDKWKREEKCFVSTRASQLYIL